MKRYLQAGSVSLALIFSGAATPAQAEDYGFVRTLMKYLETTVSDISDVLIEKMSKRRTRAAPGIVPGFNPTPIPRIENIASEIAAVTGGSAGFYSGGSFKPPNPKLPDDGVGLPN